jgi:hypothetical protein
MLHGIDPFGVSNLQKTADSTLVQRSAQKMQKLIALNENGRRIGESHPRAKLLNHEVDLVLDLLDAGLSYAEVAHKFEVSKSCIAHIANGRRRGQTTERVVRVSVNQ